MTATVIAFPTMWDRDQQEFDRTGASNYTRTFDEAFDLEDATTAPHAHPGLAQQIDAFDAALNRLAQYRPDVLDELLVLRDGRAYELRGMPRRLRARLLRNAR